MLSNRSASIGEMYTVTSCTDDASLRAANMQWVALCYEFPIVTLINGSGSYAIIVMTGGYS